MSTSSIGSLCIMCSITDTERFSTTQNRKPRPLAKCCETCLSIEVTEGTTVVPEVESQFNIDSKLKSRGWEFQEVEKRRNMGKLGRGVSFSYKKGDNTLSFTPCSGTIRSQVEGAEDQYYRSADPAKLSTWIEVLGDNVRGANDIGFFCDSFGEDGEGVNFGKIEKRKGRGKGGRQKSSDGVDSDGDNGGDVSEDKAAKNEVGKKKKKKRRKGGERGEKAGEGIGENAREKDGEKSRERTRESGNGERKRRKNRPPRPLSYFLENKLPEECALYKKALCYFGDYCRRVHAPAGIVPKPREQIDEVCENYRRGACRSGDLCNRRHDVEVVTENRSE